VSQRYEANDRPDGVLVYRHEAQLIEAGGSYLSEALADGGAAIAFASAEHLSGLEEWISLCGTDLEAAAQERRYHGFAIETALDALERDASAAPGFEAPLVEALEQIPDDLGPVRVFGEVAPALRERLQCSPRANLVTLGEALRARRRVSLLCARHADMPADAACVEQTGARGAALVQAPSFPASANGADGTVVSSAVLPPAPPACRAARKLVRAACESEADSDAIDMAVLVVSELAGNAVRHARSTFTAEVAFRNGSVRLAVTDARPLPDGWEGFPIACDHGLGLVAAVADNWAVEPLAGGKVVWAELARNEDVR
jgi:hypothetical protein